MPPPVAVPSVNDRLNVVATLDAFDNVTVCTIDLLPVAKALDTLEIVGATSSSLIVPTPVHHQLLRCRFHLPVNRILRAWYRDRKACYAGWNNQVSC